MSDEQLLFDEETIALQKTYLKRLSGYIVDIRRLQELLSRDIISITDLQKLYRLSHNYIGSGATFGFPEISRTAREFHEAINQLIHADSDAGNAIAEKNSVVETSRAFILAWNDAKNLHEAAKVVEAPKIHPASTANESYVYLIANPPEMTDKLAETLRKKSCIVVQTSIANYVRERKSSSHVGVIFSPLNEKDVLALQVLREDNCLATLLIVCPQDNFTTRLEALRLGAKQFFAPSEENELVAKIEELSKTTKAAAPSRILIIDEDGVFAQFYCATLQHSGMKTTLVSSAKEAYKLLASESFDVAIINASLPECTGQELAAIIRELPQCKDLPIIQLMDEKEQSTGQYLIKPFSPNQLLATVMKSFKN